ncbi:MAG: hypothetical protein KAI66_17745 [Lentisphaeria bacterium]|nr:hypothetical protein [Lentisphaeria bacterium]
MSLDSLKSIAEALESLGYECNAGAQAVRTKVGGSDAPFVAVLTINERNELVINCQLGLFGQVCDAEKFMLVALDANTRTVPYAIGLVTDADNPEFNDESEWPIVLTDSLPLGNFSLPELAIALDSLLQAILTCGEEFKDVFA